MGPTRWPSHREGQKTVEVLLRRDNRPESAVGAGQWSLSPPRGGIRGLLPQELRILPPGEGLPPASRARAEASSRSGRSRIRETSSGGPPGAALDQILNLLQDATKRVGRVEERSLPRDGGRRREVELPLREILRRQGLEAQPSLTPARRSRDPGPDLLEEEGVDSDDEDSDPPRPARDRPSKRQKKALKRIINRLDQAPAPDVFLSCEDRVAEEAAAHILSNAQSLQASILSQPWKKGRNKREAICHARTLDFPRMELGLKAMLSLGAAEIMLRRLGAIQQGDATGDWLTANQLEESPHQRQALPERLQRKAMRAAKLSKDLPSLSSGKNSRKDKQKEGDEE